MKYFLIITILLIFCFTSCDGRERVNKSNKENLVESKLSDSFFESIKYFPEQYAEIVTDTILNNGFRVNIKMYSDMKNSYLNDFKVDTIHYKHYYRDSKATINIFKDGNQIFSEIIDKNFFIKSDINIEEFLAITVLNGVWLDDYLSTTRDNEILINVFYCKPETDNCIFYIITIDDEGQYSIKEQEEKEYI